MNEVISTVLLEMLRKHKLSLNYGPTIYGEKGTINEKYMPGVSVDYRDYDIPKYSEDQCGPSIRHKLERIEAATTAALKEALPDVKFEVEARRGDKNYFMLAAYPKKD